MSGATSIDYVTNLKNKSEAKLKKVQDVINADEVNYLNAMP